MAFDVKVTLVHAEYSESLIDAILRTTHAALFSYGIAVDSMVNEKEYMKNISSNEINKYIRVAKKTLDDQKNMQYTLQKYDSETYNEFEVFANSRYASVSISKMDNYTVIWHNFSSKITAVKPLFDEFSLVFAGKLSGYLKCESMYFHATTFSRQDDLFVMYHNGQERFSASKKNALTDIKNAYGIDINNIMDNVDTNLAIQYAIDDYAFIRKNIKVLKDKIAAIESMLNDQGEMVGPDGTKLTSSFIAEHKALMARYEMDAGYAEKLLKMDPIGTIKFFNMKAAAFNHNIPEGGIRPGI